MAQQWSAEEILKVAWSFQQASVLTAAADLNVFTVLHDKPMTAEVVAGEIGADLRATNILSRAMITVSLTVWLNC
ncbi:MAG: methyltransferase family protein [Planctomycetota bacterium]|jgi:hypothetical protein